MITQLVRQSYLALIVDVSTISYNFGTRNRFLSIRIRFFEILH